MAFVLEDGTGLSNSNGYVSAADFVIYHTDRGRDLIDPDTAVQYTDDKIQQAIIVSSDFIDMKFMFKGVRSLVTQNMEFPRVSAYYDDGAAILAVPTQVTECISELAFRQLSSDIAPDPTWDDSNMVVIKKKDQVEDLIEEREYINSGFPIDFRAYPFAEARLKELTIDGRFIERA